MLDHPILMFLFASMIVSQKWWTVLFTSILKALLVIKIFEFSERFNKNFLWKFSICFLRLILCIQILMYQSLDFHFKSVAAVGVLLVSALMLLFFFVKNSSYIWKKQKVLANSKAYCCSNPVVSTTT